MVKYIIKDGKKYLDDILFHLRKHNTSNTGPTKPENLYVYVLDNDELVGSLKATLSWNWVELESLFYNDKEVLKLLLSKVCLYFKGKGEGITFYGVEIGRLNDFYEMGFINNGVEKGTPQTKDHYHADLTTFDILSDSELKCIYQEEVIEEYNEIIKQKVEEYKNLYDIADKEEDIYVVALDDGVFVGGTLAERTKDSLYISLLAVDENHRGRNIGTNLMNLIEEEALKKDVVSINLGTAQFQAREFYEKLGYRIIHTRLEQPKGFECYTLVKDITK